MGSGTAAYKCVLAAQQAFAPVKPQIRPGNLGAVGTDHVNIKEASKGKTLLQKAQDFLKNKYIGVCRPELFISCMGPYGTALQDGDFKGAQLTVDQCCPLLKGHFRKREYLHRAGDI